MSRRGLRVVAILLMLALLCAPAGCISGRSGSVLRPPGLPPDQVASAFHQAAAGQSAVVDAARTVLSRGLSLGIQDAQGKALNAHPLPAGAPVLSAEDFAVLAASQTTGTSASIGDLVDFLSAAGVTQLGQGEPVTTQSLLPAIQSYVYWSYSNRSDDRSLLGFMLAPPPVGTAATAAAPTLTSETRISPVAATMLLADILLGVAPNHLLSEREEYGAKVASAAAGDTALRVQGLITKIDPVLRTFAGAKVADQAKRLLAAYVAGNTFALRLLYQDSVIPIFGVWLSDSATLQAMSVARSVTIDRSQRGHWLVAALVLLPSGEIVERLPITYAFRLVAAESLGLASPMFPDADVQMAFPGQIGFGSGPDFETQQIRPEWQVQGYAATVGAKTPLGMLIGAGKLENKTPHAAVLVASASVPWIDIEPLLAQHELALAFLGCDADEIREVYQEIRRDVTISSWLCLVHVPAALGSVTVTPASLETTEGIECAFTALPQTALPEKAQYEWTADLIGDDGQLVRTATGVADDPETSFAITFPAAGAYRVTAVLRDQVRGERYAIGTADVRVAAAPAAELRLALNALPEVQGTRGPISLTAEPSGTAKALGDRAVWQWTFGDGSPTKDVGAYSRDSNGQLLPGRINYSYSTQGKYLVSVRLLDAASKAVLGTATTEVVIDDLPALQSTTAVRATLQAWWSHEAYYDREGKPVTNAYRVNHRTGFATAAGVLRWSGTSFEMVLPSGAGDPRQVLGLWLGGAADRVEAVTIAGEVSADATTLLSMRYRVSASETKTGNSVLEELQFANVPLTKTSGGGEAVFIAAIRGQDIQRYLVRRVYEVRSGGPTGELLDRFVAVDWSDQKQDIPLLNIEFRLRPPPAGWSY